MKMWIANFVGFCLLCLVSATTIAANITASVSRNPVSIDESFSLILRADGNVDGEPDLSPLKKDFDVLGTSQSTSMNYVNGNFSRKTTWTVDLIGKEVGVLTIPSIRFGKDSSPSLRITIKDSVAGTQGNGNNSPISIEVSTDKQQVWQQAQLVVTIKLYHSTDIRNASLSELETSDPYAIIEKLGEDNNYEMVRNGVRIGVIERKYAVFAQTPGKLTIKPLRFEAHVGASRRSFFDPFVTGTLKRVRSRPVEVEVRPIPAGIDAGDWLPAEKVLIKEEWSADPDKLNAGEPVTRTITLVARGILASQLPDIELPDIDGIKHYPDQPVLNSKTDGNGVVASKQIKIAMIPAWGGRYTLPQIRIPWWNTRSGKLEYATLPAKTLSVNGSTKPAQPDKPVTTDRTDSGNAISSNTAATDTAPAPLSDSSSGAAYWPWISLALATGWALSLIWLLRRKPRPTAEKVSARKRLRQAVDACQHNDAAACKQALLQWAAVQWPERRIGNLMDIVGLVDEATADAIRQLNSTLYSPHAGHWDGKPLAQALQKQKPSTAADKADTSLIEPLHRIS